MAKTSGGVYGHGVLYPQLDCPKIYRIVPTYIVVHCSSEPKSQKPDAALGGKVGSGAFWVFRKLWLAELKGAKTAKMYEKFTNF